MMNTGKRIRERTREPISLIVVGMATGVAVGITYGLFLLACSGPETPGSEQHASSELTAQERAWQQIEAGALLIDVRTPAEFAQQHLEKAINIPYDKIESRIDELREYKEREIVVYCRTGRRSGIAHRRLEKLGFTKVLNGGGLTQMLDAKK